MHKTIILLLGIFFIVFCLEKATAFPDGNKPLQIIVCPFNYPDAQAFQQDLDRIRESFFETEPFNEFKDVVIFSSLGLTKEQEAELFKPSRGEMPPLKVRTDLLETLSKKYSRYKLAVLDYTGQTHCAELSTVDKASVIVLGRAGLSKERDLERCFLHEFGHSLGLRDECVNCKAVKPGYPNCAVNKESAQAWWGDLVKEKAPGVGFIHGCCGNKEYFRPTATSLMNEYSKSTSFGLVNRRYLREVLEGLRK